jgi:hypothetical protein
MGFHRTILSVASPLLIPRYRRGRLLDFSGLFAILCLKFDQVGVEDAARSTEFRARQRTRRNQTVAEDEAVRISQRTTAALTAAKARGVLLGSARPGHWDGREAARLAGAAKGASLGGEAIRAKIAAESAPLYDEVMPIISKMHGAGDSLQGIADALNGQGFTTLRGLAWNKMQISRLIKSA